MPRFNDRLLDGLDAAAKRTGIPGLVTKPRRRHLYWLPVVALTLATAGVVLGLMRTDLLTRILDRYPGAGVEMIRFQGPDAPTWKRGPRSVPGRGPRDTYG